MGRASFVRRGLATGMVRDSGAAGSKAASGRGAQPNAAGSKLHFLRVDFHGGLDGNMYIRELTFHERVRTVYGPVDSWEQELDPTRPETLPPDSMTLTCDDLRLNEDAVAARAAADAERPPASGRSGRCKCRPGRRADRGASAEPGRIQRAGRSGQLRTGEGRVRARRRTRHAGQAMATQRGGVDSPPTEARKIRYVRSTGEVKVEGIQILRNHAERPAKRATATDPAK